MKTVNETMNTLEGAGLLGAIKDLRKWARMIDALQSLEINTGDMANDYAGIWCSIEWDADTSDPCIVITSREDDDGDDGEILFSLNAADVVNDIPSIVEIRQEIRRRLKMWINEGYDAFTEDE